VAKVAPFHTSEPETPPVYHNNDDCSEGKKIKSWHKVTGTGTGRRLCKICEGLL
jgi:hypothetical protein